MNSINVEENKIQLQDSLSRSPMFKKEEEQKAEDDNNQMIQIHNVKNQMLSMNESIEKLCEEEKEKSKTFQLNENENFLHELISEEYPPSNLE